MRDRGQALLELFWKIWLAAASVIVAVAILLVTLVTLQFSREYSRLLGERLLVIGTNAAAHFTSAADLGLPLSSVRNAAVFLDIPRQTDPLISSVRVVDADWSTIAASGEGGAPGLPAADLDLAAAENRKGWYRAADREFVAGIPIFGPDDGLAGSLLISYPSSVGRERVLAMLSELALSSAIYVAAAVLATGLLLRIWMAGQIAGFRSVEDDIEQFERRVWTLGDQAGPEHKQAETAVLSGMLAEARHAYLDLAGRLPQDDDRRDDGPAT
jgi:hypothetical protein